MSEYEWLIEEVNTSIATGNRSSAESHIIAAGAEADTDGELYGSSTYWQREMSTAAHTYAETFDLCNALEAEYRLLVG